MKVDLKENDKEYILTLTDKKVVPYVFPKDMELKKALEFVVRAIKLFNEVNE